MTVKSGDSVSTVITMTAADGSGFKATGTLTVESLAGGGNPGGGEVDPPPNPGSGTGVAQWIQPNSMTISSLETGHIGHVYAWGGEGFGYSYSYALAEAPSGVTIDLDTGAIAIATALAEGDKTFQIKVTDRTDPALITSLPFTLHVKKGVTANRTGDQILHKSYDVAAGTWGNPSVVDYTEPMKKMRKAIIADQVKEGEGNLRASILFRRGREYQYTWNRWATGIQYFKAEASGTGAIPRLKCIRNDPNDPYNSGPLGTESSNAMRYQGDIKKYCAKIKTTSVGDAGVVLVNPADGPRLKLNRMHAIISGSQQLDGYPPNVRHIDYCRVVKIEGTTVTLDRPLKYVHQDDFWEENGSWLSFGKAWIVPWDMHEDSDDPLNPRMIQRGQFISLDFIPGSSDISYMESFADMYFEDCSIPNPQFTMSQFVEVKNCRLHGGEPDKMTEQAAYLNCTNDQEMGGATGVQHFIIRGGNHRAMQVSPRQFRAIGTTIDAHGSTYLNVPFSLAYNGSIWEYEFSNVEFIADGGQKTWTWANPPVSPAPAKWDGDKFILPRSFGPFGDWVVWTYAGLLIMKEGGTVQKPGDYGIITKVYAPDDGSALWLDVEWKVGTKPTSGNLVIPQHGSRKLIWRDGTRISAGSWQDPSFECQEGTPADRPFA